MLPRVVNLVDWSLAESIGLRFAPKGPTITPTAAHGTVAELRELAQLAREPVRELTGLHADDAEAPAVVVDRGEWIQSNIEGLGVALDPFIASRAEHNASPGIEAVGSRLTAAQLGGAMAWLSGKVLGQYEAFTVPGRPGRLLLVAPNIVQVERQLELVPRDFRFWVCLHEETHRAQFGGVPWLRDHFLAEVQSLVAVSDVSVSEFLSRLGAVAQSVVGAARGREGPSLMEAIQTPAQREIFDRLTGLMSLLEGHADYVMDEVGPEHVPTVAVIRERFAARRSQAGTVDGFARRMLGMETKMRQYTSGADFVRGVIGAAGDDGFAQVWAAPANLPSARRDRGPGGVGPSRAGLMGAERPPRAAVRAALRDALADLEPGDRVVVALSGGADSLALTAGAAAVSAELGLLCEAVVVDHQLQPGSAAIAARAAEQARLLGCADVHVVTVDVPHGPGTGGVEAAARAARYAALDAAAAGSAGPPSVPIAAAVLLGHTRDDQAETVLLGLARGSGTRSLAGMRARSGRYRRPLLGLPRDVVAAAAWAAAESDLRLEPWTDPHNVDPTYARVRVRGQVLPLLESTLGPGIVEALARTAALAQEDAAALDEWADRVWAQVQAGGDGGGSPAEVESVRTGWVVAPGRSTTCRIPRSAPLRGAR